MDSWVDPEAVAITVREKPRLVSFDVSSFLAKSHMVVDLLLGVSGDFGDFDRAVGFLFHRSQ